MWQAGYSLIAFPDLIWLGSVDAGTDMVGKDCADLVHHPCVTVQGKWANIFSLSH
jgi:hypothetical protein